MFSLKEIATCTMVLFAVIDIIGSIPIVIGLRQKVGHIQSEKASLVAGDNHDRLPVFGRAHI
jgi:multiple antibiotic resistance protein